MENLSAHNVVSNKGNGNKIVNLSMTVNNDMTGLFIKLEEQEALINKQNSYIKFLLKILKKIWIDRQ